MAKEISKIEKLETYRYDGKVYVSTNFLAAYLNIDKRTITHWIKKGLEPIKNKAMSRSNLFVLQDVIVWKELNINTIQSNNGRGTKSKNREDTDVEVDYESLSTVEKREYLNRLDKNSLDEKNTTEQIIEREGKNKVYDKDWVRKEKPSQTINALARSFISLLKNMMIEISKTGENKTQDEIYHLIDRYLMVEVNKLKRLIEDDSANMDMYELHREILDMHNRGVEMSEIIKRLKGED